ncbi:hypothetical protein KL942_004436 [Ogataea angusta]|uniref:Uncharacterized protein n=1 Tax=Pichia angusta TaxID=870730 RepID=A0ABQ7RUN5_PICAN|nr:hypothetical protein KL942_004436 [Ogataea angusta]KAG7847657.1 hypothetical protein KL940_003569 [Ogataea angusta]
MLLNTPALYLLLVSAMGLPVFFKRQPGTLESTITTTIDGKAVTMLQKVYTSTDQPAQTSVVMTTLKTSYEIPISATETSDTSVTSSSTSSSSSTSTSTSKSSSSSTSSTTSSSSSTATTSSAESDDDSSASTADLVLSANVEKTSSSTTSSSATTTPSSSSPVSVASSTVSVSSSTVTPSVTTMPSASFTSFTPYATETTDGTCYVFYENGDAYDSFSPTTTQTLTVTVATVTLSTTV